MTGPPPDQQYVSVNYSGLFGVNIYVNGVLGDPDGSAVNVEMVDVGTSGALFSRPADRLGFGIYSTTLTSDETATPGDYSLVFTYAVGGVPDTVTIPLLIGENAPLYDALPVEARTAVENVLARFGDLYDSKYGGPHLQSYVQTKFGRNRLAQLLRTALGKLNIAAQPVQNFSFDPAGNVFPFDQWGVLLEEALYIEVIKHLIRTYTEQPEIILGTNVSRADRRDYANRWGEVLSMEMADYNNMLGNYKMAFMFLGKPGVMVSGGAYGRFGPIALPGGLGEAAARGYFIGRYF